MSNLIQDLLIVDFGDWRAAAVFFSFVTFDEICNSFEAAGRCSKQMKARKNLKSPQLTFSSQGGGRIVGPLFLTFEDWYTLAIDVLSGHLWL